MSLDAMGPGAGFDPIHQAFDMDDALGQMPIKVRKKPGRKPADPAIQKLRRQAQNRNSQRNFRERRERFVNELELRLRQTQELLTEVRSQYEAGIQSLMKENTELRRTIAQLKQENPEAMSPCQHPLGDQHDLAEAISRNLAEHTVERIRQTHISSHSSQLSAKPGQSQGGAFDPMAGTLEPVSEAASNPAQVSSSVQPIHTQPSLSHAQASPALSAKSLSSLSSFPSPQSVSEPAQFAGASVSQHSLPSMGAPGSRSQVDVPGFPPAATPAMLHSTPGPAPLPIPAGHKYPAPLNSDMSTLVARPSPSMTFPNRRPDPAFATAESGPMRQVPQVMPLSVDARLGPFQQPLQGQLPDSFRAGRVSHPNINGYDYSTNMPQGFDASLKFAMPQIDGQMAHPAAGPGNYTFAPNGRLSASDANMDRQRHNWHGMASNHTGILHRPPGPPVQVPVQVPSAVPPSLSASVSVSVPPSTGPVPPPPPPSQILFLDSVDPFGYGEDFDPTALALSLPQPMQINGISNPFGSGDFGLDERSMASLGQMPLKTNAWSSPGPIYGQGHSHNQGHSHPQSFRAFEYD
ncbi:uncharacterized protein BJ171DRAFT_41486 [Polychytrium aggregatum]|uniref:uncharacterized protein n=1 Tax=Polychytrium aggregatum TaxID=110093 RepID=UPI0022FF2C25|nr:uncharacterized protein BJ171DRAFT_41486 [Polychytrium aggregatum]KAI9206117.1 hypothetical protein BJ171DRAFT_41486 [Polychytrium aggregatum]